MLDVIIPTYNNKEGLIHSLQTIPNYQEISITVVDDGSDLNYNDIREQFNINFIQLEKNSGPGVARQIGITASREPYIIFLDTGDYFLEGALTNILGVIETNPNVDIFSWQYDNADAPYNVENNNIHGRVYKRTFLDKYGITFSEQGSYANEDVGFNHICRLILYHFYPQVSNLLHLNDSILVYDTTDRTSITRRDDSAFIYREQNRGLAYNAIHAYNVAKRAGVSEELLKDYLSDIMGSQYFFFIQAIEDRPDWIEEAWAGAKYFYKHLFKEVFGSEPNPIVLQRVAAFYKHNLSQPPRVQYNAELFLRLLDQCEEIPPYYKTLADNKDIIFNQPIRPYTVVTLCGSTGFKDDFMQAQQTLTLAGYVVISVGVFGHADGEIGQDKKELLDNIHKVKIDMADAIYVINRDGYIGKSTQSEIEYAKKWNKEIIYMFPQGEV